jgi:hypothetical protein
MGGEMSPTGKIPNYQLVCFVLFQIQMDFPSTAQEISPKSPILPPDKTFSK